MHTALRSAATYAWLPALLLAAPATRAPVRSRAPDPAMRVEFTITGGGHQNERVQIRDVYPEIQAPFARFWRSGAIFGEMGPVLELRAGKTGPRVWAVHFVLKGTRDSGAMPVTSAEPAVIYNGDNSPRQQSWFPRIILPPLKQGTLAATLLPSTTAGRVRGTFAGTLVDESGNEVTITNGSFDIARQPDM